MCPCRCALSSSDRTCGLHSADRMIPLVAAGLAPPASEAIDGYLIQRHTVGPSINSDGPVFYGGSTILTDDRAFIR